MPVEPQRGFSIDGRIEHPALADSRVARQHVQAGGIGSHSGADIGEGPQVGVAGQVPVRAARAGIDPAAQPAERGVGIDGDHPVLLTQLGEDRPDARRDRGLAHTAFAEHAHLVVTAERRADHGFVLRLLSFVSRRAQVDQTEGAGQNQTTPAARGLRALARGRQVLPGPTRDPSKRAGGCAGLSGADLWRVLRREHRRPRRRMWRPRGPWWSWGSSHRGTRRNRRLMGRRRVRRVSPRRLRRTARIPAGPGLQTVPQEVVAIAHRRPGEQAIGGITR